MDFEIVSKLATFKDLLLNHNRYFISNDPFLHDFKKHIERDIEREHPIMVSSLPKGSILYRARIMDKNLDNGKYYVTDMMQQYGSEFDMLEHCKICDERTTCESSCKTTSLESADKIRSLAKEAYKKISPSTEPNFNGFDKQGSSLPPKEKSDLISDMRANPKYIRYLYAANDIYTALLEARSNINSLVSVANIEVLAPIRILDITNTERFRTDDDELFLLLYELNNEFSTPVSGELKDYLTTQVISEFIKCLDFVPKFDGVCFKSSLNPRGKNYTIFNETVYQPISSEVYYINEIGLTAYGVTEEQRIEINSSNTNSQH